MSVGLSVYRSISVNICLSVCVCLPVFQSFYLFVHLFLSFCLHVRSYVCQPVRRLSYCLSIRLFDCIVLYVCLRPSISLHVCVSAPAVDLVSFVCLSVCMSASQSDSQYASMHVCLSTTSLHVYWPACTFVWVHVCLHICQSACLSACLHVNLPFACLSALYSILQS